MDTQVKKPNRVQKIIGAVAVVSTSVGIAHADASTGGTSIDVSNIVQTITNGVSTVSAIGLAVLSLTVVVKIFKWARSAM